MSLNNNMIKRFKKRITLKMTLSFIIFCVLYCLFLVAFLFASIVFSASRVWYPEDPLYKLLNFIAKWLPLFIILAVVFGFIMIFIFIWLKSMRYIEDIVLAVNKVNEFDDQRIVLNDDLMEIETILNDIKAKVYHNHLNALEMEQKRNDLVVYLAHDLKTPLTSIIGYLNLLKDEKDLPDNIRDKYLNIVYDKAERLHGLLDEFFEITKFNFTKMDLTKSSFNLKLMLEQLLFEFKPMMNSKNMDYYLEAKDVILEADANKLLRAFDNLVKNAINYGYNDSVIYVSLDVEDMIIIKFINKGPTISKEKLAKLFEKFYRVDSSRQTSTGGSGLGLAITKDIIEAHDGSISVDSSDETIIFTIELPLVNR